VANVQHGDGRQQKAVRERDEDVVQERVRERPERDDREVREPGDRAPERGLARVCYVDGFLLNLRPPAAERSRLMDSLLAAKPLLAHFFFWPFSSYS
jgi:hypothetical protein